MPAQLAVIEEKLPELFGRLMEIPCDWRNKPRGMHVGARAQIDDLTSNGVGVDDSVWENVDSTGEPTSVPEDVDAVRETVQGIRERTIQVGVWSPRQTLSQSASAYLELLRTRLRWRSSLDALRAMGVGLIRIEATQPIDPTQDDHEISEAVMDVRITHAVASSDASIPFIETVHITGKLQSAAGVELVPLEIDLNPSPEP